MRLAAQARGAQCALSKTPGVAAVLWWGVCAVWFYNHVQVRIAYHGQLAPPVESVIVAPSPPPPPVGNTA